MTLLSTSYPLSERWFLDRNNYNCYVVAILSMREYGKERREKEGIKMWVQGGGALRE